MSLTTILPAPADSVIEARRLMKLREYELAGSPADVSYDSIVKIAACICHAPISLISLLDEKKQWFLAASGTTLKQTERNISFCTHAIREPDKLMIVSDAQADARFASNPLVTGEPFIRFYAGAPLVAPSGEAIGALCVIDRAPRTLDSDQQMALQALATQVIARFELKKAHGLLQRMTQASGKVRDLERKRITRDLRDEMGQTLLAARYQISMLQREPQLSAGLRASLGKVEQCIAKVKDSVRHIIRNENVCIADSSDLFHSLNQMLVDHAARYGIHYKFEWPASIQLIDEARCRDIYHIVQEALTNIFQHTYARKVEVKFRSADGTLYCEINDDGHGIDPIDLRKPDTFGLAGIRQRALGMSGEITIKGIPGQGTSLMLTLPL